MALVNLLDAFMIWHALYSGVGWDLDPLYHFKQGTDLQWRDHVIIELDRPIISGSDGAKKAFYIRTAYRNEPDFSINQLLRIGSPLEQRRFWKLIDNDVSVSDNYQRLVSATIAGVYSGAHDTITVEELREHYIGQVRASMQRVFDDLILSGPGDPLDGGSFYFEKGISRNFHYKNLSGGEKAAFDLLLDIIMKRITFDDTVYCIDEPDLHMHTRLQARLLEELVSLIPPNSQIWIATHSIGRMRKARDLKSANPDQVVSLDFSANFDSPAVLTPIEVDRDYWSQTLQVALADLAGLIAPRQVVLCEGRPADYADPAKAEFDAKCYRVIFSREYPDTDFISVGNVADVRSDRLQVGRTIQTLITGTTVLRVVDRDDRSPQEIQELINAGVRVLSRRHLESYLFDDEVLRKLCNSIGRSNNIQDVLNAKTQTIQNSITRNNPPDDMKSAVGEAYNEIKRILQLTGAGNTAQAFMRDKLAPLITPDMNVYAALKRDIFAE
jgi:hypothetical protein